MFRYAIAIPGLAALLGGAAMPAQAATAVGTGNADAVFSLSLADGSTLSSSFLTETRDSVEQQEGSGTAIAVGDTEVDDTLTLSSQDTAEAGPGIGSAESLTRLLGTIDVTNPDAEGTQRFGFTLDWNLSASAEASGGGLATGAASISLLGPNETVLFSQALDFGDPGAYGEDAVGGVFGVGLDDGFDLAAGETASFEILTEARATASVIPLPAALPLMLTAFGGLVALRRYQRRA